MAMRVVYKEPGKAAVVRIINGSLRDMQELVGGYIETIKGVLPESRGKFVYVMNEEGKVRNLLPNRALYDHHGYIFDVICGPYFVCAEERIPDTGDRDLVGLTEEEAKLFMWIENSPHFAIYEKGKR